MMDIKLISLQKHGDERGALIALEEQRNIPFEVKRIYYILETLKGVRRGFHAHKVTRQLAIVVKGLANFIWIMVKKQSRWNLMIQQLRC